MGAAHGEQLSPKVDVVQTRLCVREQRSRQPTLRTGGRKVAPLSFSTHANVATRTVVVTR